VASRLATSSGPTESSAVHEAQDPLAYQLGAYFRVADNAADFPQLRHAELRAIPSIWGHRAGSPATNPADFAFLRNAVHQWLEQAAA
jgi:hypothetical protein